MEKHPADLYKDHVRPFLYSKLEEFKILGYDDVELESLWSYLTDKKWKKKTELSIYELASDILSVKIGEFMNYATVESFKTSNWLGSEEGQEALEELLR
ncbi:post-transcriptional regulator ComN [Bacillus subtilis]|uniref:Post-transcriptional regulator ComN n=5 Tax=Bacillus subtilis TaxID=1423 RepID=COMN_BACSU|nr:MULTISPECIES: post-transcriptional regulator ComN [Bacillales]NP_390644.1 post-transcriptional regulator [Bacillus subtilis subsp. subtilis str. 168]O32049.1 RecName: Full=Post-transcriptional regulator ComN [Bacillus subtilis subsp. subtilis str. 168]BAM53199.1 post-transcriptional regulator [Bacillus subtilis BEST7613]AFQ58609.1 Post-transcriptional regulator [Bacillus subtilis QB928]AGG62170.1 post-transcriptional regulator ComN [Bacillus subtilis subsp. subtilis 6051-HGW]AHA78661.1 Unc